MLLYLLPSSSTDNHTHFMSRASEEQELNFVHIHVPQYLIQCLAQIEVFEIFVESVNELIQEILLRLAVFLGSH